MLIGWPDVFKAEASASPNRPAPIIATVPVLDRFRASAVFTKGNLVGFGL
jgi:hypothetical protein